uniref:Uncharacterized protein n=1 Tax=Amphimedon queenslandica TaxID=400682 RepID=A0A1X7VL77_AMPQE
AVDLHDDVAVSNIVQPPSVQLKEMFIPSFTEYDIRRAAKEVMLTIEDVTL